VLCLDLLDCVHARARTWWSRIHFENAVVSQLVKKLLRNAAARGVDDILPLIFKESELLWWRLRYTFTGLDGPLGLQEIEAARISRQFLCEDDKVFQPYAPAASTS
jgi:hypothetical protein